MEQSDSLNGSTGTDPERTKWGHHGQVASETCPTQNILTHDHLAIDT